MLYGLETVSLKKRQESELEVAELKMLRFSLGVTRLDRVRNEYIRGTAHVGRLGDKVREARLRWFGHVQRRESENIVAGLHTLTGPSEVKQCAGRSIRIVCHYHSFYRDNVKYWCKGYYFNYCSILIRTGQSQNAYEPLQITDNKRDGLFTVHMKNAKAEDSGWYWCAIERVSRHVRTAMQLIISADRAQPVQSTCPFCPYTPKCPSFGDLNPIKHLWDVLDKQVRSMEGPPRNLQDLKDLLLTSWCQIPQHTFRDLVESMPRRVGKGQMVGCGDRIVRGVVGMICKLQGVQLSWQQRWVSV
ncbi:hypothetical protein QTP70_013687 [Hemibagrus guttatus]|uniref:Immunoglobulin V-set domain-containing protein n=1 Tax=Hemibagrus guttatus TaxID=175788 RepID=A0AAE0R4L4_9TELE|nr:hypothetical protein QTP70_013687 [Hemibagrus guttatus]